MNAAFLPPLLGDDHLCSDAVEGLPQICILQSHPDAALLVGLWWGGAGHTAVGFKVWGRTRTHKSSVCSLDWMNMSHLSHVVLSVLHIYLKQICGDC